MFLGTKVRGSTYWLQSSRPRTYSHVAPCLCCYSCTFFSWAIIMQHRSVGLARACFAQQRCFLLSLSHSRTPWAKRKTKKSSPIDSIPPLLLSPHVLMTIKGNRRITSKRKKKRGQNHVVWPTLFILFLSLAAAVRVLSSAQE